MALLTVFPAALPYFLPEELLRDLELVGIELFLAFATQNGFSAGFRPDAGGSSRPGPQ
jgi:hypothetical protein